MLLHIGNNSRTLLTRALSSPPLQSIGRVSYSIYLWHWPFIALGTYFIFDRSILPIATICLKVISAFIGFASYRYIETPFRGAFGLLNRRQVFWERSLYRLLLDS